MRGDLQQSQQQLAEQGAQLHTCRTQLVESKRQGEAARISLEQRAKVKMLLGLLVGTTIGIVAGVLGYTQLV